MVNDKKWCVIIPQEKEGSSKYVNESSNGNSLSSYRCEADSRANLLTNEKMFESDYVNVKKLNDLAYKNLNVVNVNTIDIDETLKDEYLFSDKSVTTYTYFPYHDDDGMFKNMCFDHRDSYLLPKYDYIKIIENEKNQALRKKIDEYAAHMRKRESPSSYLIELTSSVDVISNFKKMNIHGGETDSSSGLLRSLPVIAKGTNPRKVIIMVSDGADSSMPKKLATVLHRDYHICERIKEGLLKNNKIHKTKEVEIVFLSLAKKGIDDDNVKFLRDYCGKAFVVSDSQSLANILAKTSKKEKNKLY